MQLTQTKRTSNHGHGIYSIRARSMLCLEEFLLHHLMKLQLEVWKKKYEFLNFIKFVWKIIKKKLCLHLAAESSGDVTVGDCADVDCAAKSESVGDLITEPSLSDPSSIKDCTFENTPKRAK